MVISEKQVADQLKAFNIGFKPTKEQVEEALLFIDAVRVNHPDKYKKYQKDIFDPYEEKVQSLESDYGVFQHSIVLEASVAEKALLKQVDENNEKAKMESTTNIKPAVESIQQKYTDRMLPTFSDRIKSAQEKLKNGNDRAKKLAELLAIALKDTSASNVSRLQEEMIKDRPSVKVSSNNFPDGKFGPLTMDSLTNIADGKVQELPVSTTTDKPAQNTPENNTKQPTSLVANVKTKMRSAGEAVADMVSGTAHAETVKNSPKAPAVSSGPKAAPQNGFALKDGTKVQGMYVKEGRMWFIGAKGERKELNPSLLPDRVNAKEITAINENAKKLTSLVSDVELVLQATANHAKIANWPNPQSWENKLVELGNMLQTLDISDENKARRAILDFVQAVPVAKGNLSKEFAEIFNFADNDTERHARVYKYIRGSWYNPTASGAGFNG